MGSRQGKAQGVTNRGGVLLKEAEKEQGYHWEAARRLTTEYQV